MGNRLFEEPEVQVDPPSELTRALRVEPRYIGKNRFDYLVEVDSERTVRNLSPDCSLLETIPCRGVIVTSLADSKEFDFVPRFLPRR